MCQKSHEIAQIYKVGKKKKKINIKNHEMKPLSNF